MVFAKPAQGAEPVQCSGAAKIKPPFEMGVDNFDSIINVLNTFKSLCEGNYINGVETYKTLYEIIMDMNEICPDISISDFYHSLKDKENVFVEKSKIPFQIRLKQFILDYL